LWPRKSHPSRDSHQRGLRQQQVVAQKIPSIKGFPPKRPETTTSYGPVNPIHEGIPIKNLYEDFEKMNAYEIFT
jgi:hypothetical protein